MFHFCIADTQHDWREGTEQYKFIKHCLASLNRQKQPWLIFLAHRVLGYHLELAMQLKDHSRKQWGGRACKTIKIGDFPGTEEEVLVVRTFASEYSSLRKDGYILV